MHWMSVDWFAVMFWGMSMDSVFLFDGCPRAWRQWQGASKKKQKSADTRGDLRSPGYRPSIAQASLGHRSGIARASLEQPKFWTMWSPKETQ